MRSHRNIILLLASLLVTFALASGTYFLSSEGFFETSYALVSDENQQLSISFDIAKKDREKADMLSQNLGVDSSWENGIKIKVDPGTLNILKNNLPLKLALVFEDKGIEFKSRGTGILNSSLVGQNYNFATGSGSLKLSGQDSRDFVLNIRNPRDLLVGATPSGSLYLSTQIKGLLELSQKIDTIDLKVNSGNVTGDINLK